MDKWMGVLCARMDYATLCLCLFAYSICEKFRPSCVARGIIHQAHLINFFLGVCYSPVTMFPLQTPTKMWEIILSLRHTSVLLVSLLS